MSLVILLALGCQVPVQAAPADSDPPSEPACALDPTTTPTLSRDLSCPDDWGLMAAPATDRWAPGATSVVTVLDLQDDTLYFADTQRFPDAWSFVSSTLARDEVVDREVFFRDNHTRPDRRWLIGAVTRYPDADLWVWEPAPYDTADAAMLELGFRAAAAHLWIGAELRLHLTSDGQEALVLPADIPTTTTRLLRLFAPSMALTEGSTVGRVAFATQATLSADPSPRELLVIDALPEDLPPRGGVITASAPPPLAPANLLARATGTPLLWLTDAAEHPDLRALDGGWAQFDLLATGWSIQPRTDVEAESWWRDVPPIAAPFTPFRRDVTAIVDIEALLRLDLPLEDALVEATAAYGGAAAHLAVLPHVGRPVPAPEGAVIPIVWFSRHMDRLELNERFDELLTRPTFVSDPEARAQELRRIQADIREAPLDDDVRRQLRAALEQRFPGASIRLTASTNAEDDGGLPSADLYPDGFLSLQSTDQAFDQAIKDMWAELWSPRAWEAHARRELSHREIGMALIATPERPARALHGVAITRDAFGLTTRVPTLYLNAQTGPGPLTNLSPAVEQALVWADWPGAPVTRLSDSALVPEGERVIDAERLADLANVVDRIHSYFAPAYGEEGPYSMEIGFTLGAGGPEIEHVHPWTVR